jgi:pimeloyl-ACP methyl ester carboxylesterase
MLKMPIKNHVIIIPGLGNGVSKHLWAAQSWKKYGIIPHVFDTKWKIVENGFPEKFNRALKLIDSLSDRNSWVSIVGNSAGSSFALNLYGKRRAKISRVIINCGRVRDGDWPWFTFDQATASSPSFKESVLRSQELEKTLTTNDRKKILTLRPLFDEVVPPSTVPINGAKNKVIFSLEHSLTIALNMTLFKKQIIDFILLNRAR